jgi:hypothetical protein
MAICLDRFPTQTRITAMHVYFDEICELQRNLPARTHPEVAKTKRAFREIVRNLVSPTTYGQLYYKHRIVVGTENGKVVDSEVHVDFPSNKILMTIGNARRSLATVHFPNWEYDNQVLNPTSSELFNITDDKLCAKPELELDIQEQMAGWFMAKEGELCFLDFDDVHAASPVFSGEAKVLFWAYNSYSQPIEFIN